MFPVQVFAVLNLLAMIECTVTKIRNLHPNTGLNTTELVSRYGYPIESHQVQTEDGYLLTMHRIPCGTNNCSNQTGPPVLLMHGLLSSSADWVNMGPNQSLAFLLANNGFDVWIGNQRGNTWSRMHTQNDPDQNPEKFFDFSFHEIGVYDLPAKIDYILDKTGEHKLLYVGHSQGTTEFFVMASEKPQYNEKIRLMVGLAPVAYVENLPNPFVRYSLQHLDLIKLMVEIFNVHELLPHYDFFTELGKQLCSDSSVYQELCILILNSITGFDNEIDPNFIPVITSNAPAGAAVKEVLHYLQEIESGTFGQYDYGTTGNMAKYGQDRPPIYDIAKITAPVSLYYGNNDWLAAVKDVQRLAKELPNLVTLKQVTLAEFNHLDFLWAQHVLDLLYNDIITEINLIKY